jgi:hypothetical protein
LALGVLATEDALTLLSAQQDFPTPEDLDDVLSALLFTALGA